MQETRKKYLHTGPQQGGRGLEQEAEMQAEGRMCCSRDGGRGKGWFAEE